MNGNAASDNGFPKFLRIVAGPMIWAAHFFSLYASETLLCLGLKAGANFWLPLLGSLLTAAALAAILVAMAKQRLAPAVAEAAYERRLSLMLSAAALIAVAWTALPVIMLDACHAGGT